MNKSFAGRFVFIPENGDEAFEIDIQDILASTKKPSLWLRIKRFFAKFRTQKQAVITEDDIIPIMCNKLELFFASAQWHLREDLNVAPSFVLDVFPGAHAEGWEFYITLATGGTTKKLSMAELITNYIPAQITTSLLS